METKWTEKEIGFQVELEEVKYTANEGLFMHIWINLLDNAIKFSPSKGTIATVYKGNIIKNLIMDCQSYTKYRPNETRVLHV